ncbi:Alpha-2-macroglobulin family protein [Gemmata obscuriglobus]|uniref:alpha-2-macroglobulin family protein n=1 Tax=Gemmata obscuriglobus TaxID=114 RepID=UPI00016C588D|nr:alpha-2-macroglobulin family protein [Gemmata obscuriglobus]QEG32219.1 Alpha-2-macroglobulin family protein [Gemmata obscuriglobus]VTS11572.1 large extracellular alpha-helical protein : Large extracellular alpha-helical protein OS=Ignavibacterium album (strain DSM 19864 / JCM 16511 / NBRC 101810 / Mat9-16) GN=IALB_0524 PE=4 SV=1: A2M_N: A2M_N_2: A2M: Thiol-ester_cl [Gemmata obscuriglobus UQM 2246]
MMRWVHSLPRWLSATAAGLFLISAVLALGSKPPGQTEGESEKRLAAKEPELVPLFAQVEPAANKPELILLPDETGLRGWVAGGRSYDGATVTIKAGNVEHKATLSEDNTFEWANSGATPRPVTVTVPARNGNKALTARTTLPAKAERVRQSAFIVTDRSAYRPGHTLKFVAHLHHTADGLEFTPLANRDFMAELVSETRRTRAARVKVRSDASGRVTGEYTFADADALDHYTLRILHEAGATPLDGAARVLLGEYRKTQVSLKLKGEVRGGKLVVTFDARDYLGRAVAGASATWSAVVTRAAEVGKLALEPEQFVANEGGPPSADDFDALPSDERLLTLANNVSAMSFAGLGARTVAAREGKAEFALGRPTTTELDLWPAWLRGEHSVAVTARFLDETGRESNAAGTFSLAPAGAKALRIVTPKELYTTDEKVTATVTIDGLGAREAHTTTVAVVKLGANFAAPWATPAADSELTSGGPRLAPLGAPAPAPVPATGWTARPVFDPVKRTFQSVVPVANGAADVMLREPGAYKLLAVSRLGDGTVLQSETGVVVKHVEHLPGLALRLDAREVPAGSTLTGAVHTRFAGARVLLTLRDAAGVKLVKVLTTGPNGVARVDEQLPANLRYGCAVCAQYPEAPGRVHADQHDLYVVPTDRTLTVATTVPETVRPGAEVKLGFHVNRAEEVDLIVSVFDESLLRVAGDLSVDVRSRFLADARGRGRAARDLVATRLGSVGVAELVAKARKLLADKAALAKEPGVEHQLQHLAQSGPAGVLTLGDIVTLVRLAGFTVYVAQPSHPQAPQWKVPKAALLADLFRPDAVAEETRQRLSAAVIGTEVLIGLVPHNGPDPWAGHRGNLNQAVPCYGFGCSGSMPSGSFCGGFNCGGYQPNGQFGIAGFSGGGFSGVGGGQLGQYGNLGNGIGGFGGGFAGINGGFGGGIAGGIGGIGGGVAGHGNAPRPGAGGAEVAPPPGPVGLAGGPLPGAAEPGLGAGEELVRRDRADSAFWSASLRTDRAGAATATFKVPDALTGWRVQVTAVSPKMHVGTATARFETSRLVMIWPMLPRAFAEGDVARVFGTVHNLSDQEQNVRAHLRAENGRVLSAAEQVLKVPANGTVPVYWTYKAGAPGTTELLMSVKSDAGTDAALKKIPVTSPAVPERVTVSGVVGRGALTFEMPEGFNPKTAQVTVAVAPTIAADLADTLPYLVEYPYGCVEQTMSRFLPALRVAAILKQSGIGVTKELEEKLPKVVDAGQKRLIQLQQPDGGWGWQGSGQTHEMMTPYALFGLLAAEDAGYPCPSPTAIGRGMARLKQYLDHTAGPWDLAISRGWGTAFGAGGRNATEVNDALFCLWVAGLSGEHLRTAGIDLSPWFGRIDKTAGHKELSDTGHAQALELAVKHRHPALADKLAKELHRRAKNSGERVFWTRAGFSRWGDNTTEVTATVMKALVARDPTDPLIPGVLAYFHGTKRGDRWDSTKDTACVLYALCDYLAAVRAGPAALGSVKVFANGTERGGATLDSTASKVMTFGGAALKPGDNTIEVRGAEAAGALVRVQVRFTRASGEATPARDHGVKMTRTVSVRGADGNWTELASGASVPVGSFVKVRVTATPSAGALQFFLIESPKPAGAETIPATDKRFPTASGHVLREDREGMTCFHYETAPAATAEFVALTEFAGEFTLPPARGELMYQPASGGHSDSFVLKVTAK